MNPSPALHDGRTPFVDPVPLVRWAWSDTISQRDFDEAARNMTIFRDWFNTKVLHATDDASCSSSLIIYPGGLGGGRDWRSTYRVQPTGPPFGFISSTYAVFAGNPDSVFPIGEAAAYSGVSSHEEVYPVTVDVMAAVGCDGLLARLAVDLVEKGLVVKPTTGRSVLDGGDMLM